MTSCCDMARAGVLEANAAQTAVVLEHGMDMHNPSSGWLCKSRIDDPSAWCSFCVHHDRRLVHPEVTQLVNVGFFRTQLSTAGCAHARGLNWEVSEAVTRRLRR